MPVKIFKKIFLFSLLFLLSCFFKVSYAKQKPYLHLKVRLLLLSDSTIIGSVSTKLLPHKNYTFLLKGLRIKRVKLGKRYVRIDTLKHFYVKRKKTLYIIFKKHINYQVFPLNVFSNFFPLPQTPFTYEIIFKVPKNKKVYLVVPSDEIKIYKKRYYKIYIFKSRYLVTSPCLIMSRLRITHLSFYTKYLNFRFYYYNRKENKNIKNFWNSIKGSLNIVDNLVWKGYPFKRIFIFFDDSFKENVKFSNTILLNTRVFNTPEEFLHCLAEKKLKRAILLKGKEKVLAQGLVDYLLDYNFAQNKKLFRKRFLIFKKNRAKAFFYILELVRTIGKDNFIKDVKGFYQRYFLTPQNFDSFLEFFRMLYPEKLKNFPDFSDFKRITIKAKLLSVMRTQLRYITNLLIKTYPERPLTLSFEVLDSNGTKYFQQVNISNSTQRISLYSKGDPVAVFIDPDYFLWRNFSQEEVPISIADLLKSSGILVYSENIVPIYREVINFFRDMGYKRTELNKSVSITDSQNVIYLEKSPFSWIFHPPVDGFYIKVIPNPFNNKGFVGFIKSSSIDETQKAIKLLSQLTQYSKIIIKSGKLIYRRQDQAINGIFLPVRRDFYIRNKRNHFSIEELVSHLISHQIIIFGESKADPVLYVEFYKRFLNDLYRINPDFIIAVDLDPALQNYINAYLTGKIDFEELLSHLDFMYLDIKLESLKAILDWAKSKNIKVLCVGVDSHLLNMVLRRGLLNLPKKEMLKLPEMDLFNFSYKNYLLKRFKNTGIYNGIAFENFYQAQVLKRESLAEHIKELLNKFKNTQIVVFTNEEKIQNPWGIRNSLFKRGIKDFQTIILDSRPNLNPDLADYLISGEEEPPTN